MNFTDGGKFEGEMKGEMKGGVWFDGPATPDGDVNCDALIRTPEDTVVKIMMETMVEELKKIIEEEKKPNEWTQ